MAESDSNKRRDRKEETVSWKSELRGSVSWEEEVLSNIDELIVVAEGMTQLCGQKYGLQDRVQQEHGSRGMWQLVEEDGGVKDISREL